MNAKDLRILFMGTPEFAVASLRALVEGGYNVVAVVTAPDKPAGRGQKLHQSDVKRYASELGLKVLQPVKLRDPEFAAQLEALKPDLGVVIAFRMLPESVWNLPRLGTFNLHASLLPQYRGAAPINWAIINGETESGVTTMYMDAGLDTGDMIMKKSCPIDENMTAGQLHDKLSEMGAQLIVETLAAVENGTAKREKQDDNLSCYSPMLDKTLCKIDWTKSNLEIHNKVRGLNPWPVAASSLNGKRVKIFSTKLNSDSGAPGEVISLSPLTVACGQGSVVLLELQLEGKKRMDAAAFLNGHSLRVFDKFE